MSLIESLLLWIIRLGAYGALLTPLIVHPRFIFPFVVPKTIAFWIFAEIIFASWILLALRSKAYRPRFNVLILAVFAFFAANVLSAFQGVNVAGSFWSTYERMGGVIALSHLLLFFAAIASTFKTLKEWTWFWLVSVGAASIAATLFFLDRFGLSVFPMATYGGSTLGNSSFMGAYLLFHIFMGLWLLRVSAYLEIRIFYGLLIAIMTLAVWHAQALGALFSIIAGLFLIGATTLFFGGGLKRKAAAIALFLFACIAGSIIFVGTVTQKEAIASRLPDFFSSGSMKSRILVWDIAWKGFLEKPLFGWGPENFHAVFEKHFNPCFPFSRECGGELWFDRSHNIILDQFVNGGIVGAVAYLGLFAAAAFSIFRRWILSARFLLWGVLSGSLLGAYFIQNLFVFDMPSVSVMFFSFLAFVAARGRRADDHNNNNNNNDNDYDDDKGKTLLGKKGKAFYCITAVTAMALGAGMFFFGVRPLQSAYNVFRITSSSGAIDERVTLYQKTLRLSPLATPQAQVFFTGAVTEEVQRGQEISQKAISAIEEELEKSIKNSPLNLRVYYTLGNFYNVLGERKSPMYFEKAESVFKKAIELSPSNQQGYAFLALSYFGQGKHESAVELLQKSVELEPRLAKSYWELAKGFASAGNFKEARREAERALELDSSLEQEISPFLQSVGGSPR